ncbi:hypothetical protein [Roseomonas sp. USHLN139]|uniref:hypothetical protein n=1 Tax=Roseomonas sp. USHLN139 TaxID=3081298 RepID=UPI003B0189CF
MARKTAHPAAEPEPQRILTKPALERIAALAARPAAPDRMRREVQGMVQAWLDGAGEEQRIELRDRLGEMQEQLLEGIEAAGDMMDDVDASDTVAQRHGNNALAALKAAREALVAAGRGL